MKKKLKKLIKRLEKGEQIFGKFSVISVCDRKAIYSYLEQISEDEKGCIYFHPSLDPRVKTWGFDELELPKYKQEKK